MKNLEFLNLEHNSIDKIPERIFEEFKETQIEYLHVNNEVIVIEDMWCRGGNQLKRLDLSDNRIKALKHSHFEYLENIIDLNLS